MPNVTTIGSEGFHRCNALTTLNAPALEEVNNYGIANCPSLTNIDFSGVTKVGACSFLNDVSLIVIDMPNLIQAGQGAFSGCTSVLSYNIGESCDNYKTVDGVLYNKDMTELIHYPAGKPDKSFIILKIVTTINPQAFLDCDNLTSIEVEAGNTVFTSKNGCLFDIAGTKLIVCPAGIESFTLGSDVESVGGKAFSGTKLKELTISADSKIHFETDSFFDCDNLEKITIHENVDMTFGDNAIKHLQTDEKTILVITHDHGCIPDHALHGNVKVAYGSHSNDSGSGTSTDDPSDPSNPSDSKKDNNLIMTVVLLSVAFVPIIIATVFCRKS